MAAPQTQFAVYGERAPDRGQIFSFVLQRRDRPVARREVHSARCAVSDDMHRVETATAFERRRDLPRRRHGRVEHDRLYSRSQAAEDRVDIGDGGINKKDFAGAGHGAFLNIFYSG